MAVGAKDAGKKSPHSRLLISSERCRNHLAAKPEEETSKAYLPEFFQPSRQDTSGTAYKVLCFIQQRMHNPSDGKHTHRTCEYSLSACWVLGTVLGAGGLAVE